MNEYVLYYHEERTHLALAKETPSGRVAVSASVAGSKVIVMPRLGVCIIAMTSPPELLIRTSLLWLKMATGEPRPPNFLSRFGSILLAI
jgi:hypothetical protein